jgi:hypothetical protein
LSGTPLLLQSLAITGAELINNVPAITSIIISQAVFLRISPASRQNSAYSGIYQAISYHTCDGKSKIIMLGFN